MERVYNKLVRDKIPEIIKNNNEECSIRILNDNEYKIELLNKLKEECNEVIKAETKKELKEELSDVYEVLRSILKLENISMDNIISIADSKKEKRGGFDKKIFLEKTYKKNK